MDESRAENNKLDIEILKEKDAVKEQRLTSLEKKVEDLIDFKYTVKALSETVSDLKITVDKIKSQDGETYRKLKYAVVSGVVLAILGFMLGKII